MGTSLVQALERLDLKGEVAMGGRWLTLRGERATVYVVQVTGGYFTWGDDPADRTVEAYRTAEAAIVAGLQRAAAHHLSRAGPGESTAHTTND